jgi:hypothetical protein
MANVTGQPKPFQAETSATPVIEPQKHFLNHNGSGSVFGQRGFPV